MSDYRPDNDERAAYAYPVAIARLRARLRALSPRCLSLDGFRPAAVAVMLLDIDGLAHVVLTKRSPALRAHSGQVSLPGGACDPEDGSATVTATRESREEIGIEADDVEEILGTLDDEPTPSRFVITPVVATLRHKPAYKLSIDEVTHVFEAPLGLFSDTSRGVSRGQRCVGDLVYPLRAYRYREFEITGATAHILECVSRLAGPER